MLTEIEIYVKLPYWFITLKDRSDISKLWAKCFFPHHSLMSAIGACNSPVELACLFLAKF